MAVQIPKSMRNDARFKALREFFMSQQQGQNVPSTTGASVGGLHGDALQGYIEGIAPGLQERVGNAKSSMFMDQLMKKFRR